MSGPQNHTVTGFYQIVNGMSVFLQNTKTIRKTEKTGFGAVF